MDRLLSSKLQGENSPRTILRVIKKLESKRATEHGPYTGGPTASSGGPHCITSTIIANSIAAKVPRAAIAPNFITPIYPGLKPGQARIIPVSSTSSSLPPIVGAEFSASIAAAQSAIQGSALAPTTTVSYSSAANKITAAIENRIKELNPGGETWKVLPLTSEQKIKDLFTILFSDRSINSTYIDHKKDIIKWSIVQLYKSALRHIHIVNNWDSPLIKPSQNLLQFWEGLKRVSSHTKRVKQPVDATTVIETCRAAEIIISSVQEFKKFPSPTELALVRRACELVIGFFGVRRNQEVLHVKVEHVDFSHLDYTKIFVPQSKRDQLSKGHTTIIPSIPKLGFASPTKIVKAWIQFRKSFLLRKGIQDLEFLFIRIQGRESGLGKILSPDSLTKDLKKALTDTGTPPLKETIYSLRKGGAAFYCAADPAARATAHFLADWSTTSMLDLIYAPITPAELAQISVPQAIRGVDLWLVRFALTTINRSVVQFKSTTNVARNIFTILQHSIVAAPKQRVRQLAPDLFNNFNLCLASDPRIKELAVYAA